MFGFPHLGLDANTDGLPRLVGVANDAVGRRAASAITCIVLVPLQKHAKTIFFSGGPGQGLYRVCRVSHAVGVGVRRAQTKFLRKFSKSSPESSPVVGVRVSHAVGVGVSV